MPGETSPGQVSSVSWSRSVLSPLLRVAASSQPCGTDSGQDLEDGSVPDQASSLNPDTASCATRKRSSLGLAVNKSTRSLSHIDRSCQSATLLIFTSALIALCSASRSLTFWVQICSLVVILGLELPDSGSRLLSEKQ